MIYSVVAILIISIITIFFANGESISDYVKIKNKVKIDHTESWIFRAIIVTTLTLLVNIQGFFLGLILLFGEAFLFSFVFRSLLNIRRGKKLTYISKSNHYDNFFIKRFKKNPGIIMIVSEITIFLATSLIYLFI